MKYQHWTLDASYKGQDAAPGDEVFSPASYFKDPRYAYMIKGFRFCCEIEADNWCKAMVEYHDHMRWEPYVPFGEDDEEKEKDVG